MMASAERRDLPSQTVDRAFEALARRPRRVILVGLRRGEIEHEREVAGERAEQIELRHTHLPKLAEAEYIDWDPETGDIAKGPRFDEIEELLGLLDKHCEDLL